MMKSIFLKLFILLFLATLPSSAKADEPQALEEKLKGPSSSAGALEKITLGEVEDIMLIPWTVTLPARIDTGASFCSLDARDLSVENNMAEFMLGKRYGRLRLRLPVVEWIHVRNSAGVEKRPVVKIGFCLGSKMIRALATLRDRSQMTYPFLVGRNVLSGGFMVDTSRSRTAQPRCRSRALLVDKSLYPASPYPPLPNSE
jgi:hypothetical protein